MVLDRFRWLKNSSFLYDGDLKLYMDPWGVPDGAPEADLILVTHSHFDHFSVDDIAKVRGAGTAVVATSDVAAQLEGDVQVISPGDAFEAAGISIDAVAAYNQDPDRLNFHPQANGWVGYVFALEGTRCYHAGDTDSIPEMEQISCDVAFLPIGGTYTMTAEEAAEAVTVLDPGVVVPMHYGFVAGGPRDGDRFKELVTGGEVRTFTPENPFESA
jgi:L-ascorbate metabolism protein UlaG (beta-lactamase superfamily)